MKKLEQLYEGKAKKVYATDDPNLVIVDYKDDATAGDGAKKGTIRGKGVVNNKLTNNLMKMLAGEGVPTHFVEELSDRETVVKKVEIVPLEVIVRNVAAGSFTKRLGVPEGTVLKIPTIEFSYKNDEYHDPLINSYHARALLSLIHIFFIRGKLSNKFQNQGNVVALCVSKVQFRIHFFFLLR